ncbi:MAG TPA: 3-deoxy-manno-octulosonate cytidylyltransferase [Chiayiivirga sp.]|nr:3-deoxy-manno-octulosonate cytidylyltransferase [Chiayiivirga sp.]
MTDTAPPDFVVAIPARYASTRLPGKPLRLIAGEPMIVHVARRAREAGAREVVVATDDARIADALAPLGVTVCMTSSDHASGTDRLAETAAQRGWSDDTLVVNLQGDEPLAPPAAIRAAVDALIASGAPIATLAQPISGTDELFDPNCVKLVRDAQGIALYFSRAPIPWHRDAFARDRVTLPAGPWLRHIGLYVYRVGALREFAAMPPGALEQIESLEQLRALEAGWRIAVALSPEPFPAGVDTEEDLARVEREMRRG